MHYSLAEFNHKMLLFLKFLLGLDLIVVLIIVFKTHIIFYLAIILIENMPKLCIQKTRFRVLVHNVIMLNTVELIIESVKELSTGAMYYILQCIWPIIV